MKIINISLLILFSLCILACDHNQQDPDKNLLDSLGKSLESFKKQINTNEIDSLATEELEKLFIFEYKVHEFSSNLTNSDLELELNQLGKERWECFHIEINKLPNEISVPRAFCKRRPKTYLRYIPRVF